jgi:hypothetical protein
MWSHEIVRSKIEKLFPFMKEEDLQLTLCQCHDRMLYSESEIYKRWGINVWAEKRKQYPELGI